MWRSVLSIPSPIVLAHSTRGRLLHNVAVLCKSHISKMPGFQEGENRIQNLYLFHCKFTFVELLELNEFVLGLPGVQKL